MPTPAFVSPAVESEFAPEVRQGLLKDGQKELPCRYFYDAVGSALFEVITLLPEYGLTRADARLIRAHAADIAGHVRAPVAVAELGSGSGTKTRWILEALAGPRLVTYYPIDVSTAALEHCAQEVGHAARVAPIAASYLEGLAEAAARRDRGQRLLVLFLGSTIGNFDRRQVCPFLCEVRARLQPGDALLLGADLEKPLEQLLLAYDDPAGVTAAFNLNLLAHLNRELGANFDLRNFAHEARYNRLERRIEMHLRAKEPQTVSIPGAGLTFELRAHETIRTECSHKFDIAEIDQMARAARFRTAARWTDEEWPFAETLLIAEQ